MKTIGLIHTSISIAIFCVILIGTGCRSIAEDIAYHHSDEKKQGITQWEYERKLDQQRETAEKEIRDFEDQQEYRKEQELKEM